MWLVDVTEFLEMEKHPWLFRYPYLQLSVKDVETQEEKTIGSQPQTYHHVTTQRTGHEALLGPWHKPSNNDYRFLSTRTTREQDSIARIHMTTAISYGQELPIFPSKVRTIYPSRQATQVYDLSTYVLTSKSLYLPINPSTHLSHPCVHLPTHLSIFSQ